MTEPNAVLVAPKRKRGRTGLIAVAIAVPALLLGGGAYAYQQLNGGGPQPDDVFPSTVIAYARLDANPSAAQKVKLFKLLKKVPDLANEVGVKGDHQDVRKNVLKAALSDCPEIDYAGDIKPWIGDRLGVGVLDVIDQKALLAIQVTDESKARTGIEQVAACLGYPDPGVAFSKGYALIGNSQADVDAAVTAADRKPLSAVPAFTEDMQSLGDQGVASLWFQVQATSENVADVSGAVALQTFENVRSLALTVRAGDDSIELAGIGHSILDLGEVSLADLGDVSASSVIAASFAGSGRAIREQWPATKAAMAREFEEYALSHRATANGDFDDVLDGIEEETGFRLPDDLETLYGDKLTFVVGDTNLDSLDSIEGPDDVADLDAALALESSSAPATELAHRIADQIETVTGIPLVVRSTDNGAILATNESFAENFHKGDKLGDTDEFTSVVDDESTVTSAIFVNLERIIELTGDTEWSVADLDERKALKSLGIVNTRDGDRVSGWTVRLSFN